MSQAVKRACDACHRRKVKCDGVNPCRNCSSAQLTCTYHAIPQKKGPKGSRAKVISELRETQRLTSLSAKVQDRMTATASATASGTACPPSESHSPTPGLVTPHLVKDCAAFFFRYMYPQTPILDPSQLDCHVLYDDHNRDAHCLITVLSAFVMLQPGMSMPSGDPYHLDLIPGANIVSSHLLLEEAHKIRKAFDYLDPLTINSPLASYFFFACYYAHDMHDKAWYYLREATTMLTVMGMDKEHHFLHLKPTDVARRRRLYWLLYSTERAYAIFRGRPLTLKPTINPPTMADDPADPLAHQLRPFLLLVNFYRLFDDALIDAWSNVRSLLSTHYIANLQKQQNDLHSSYSCHDANFTDLASNQQWLKSTIWQLTNTPASPNSNDAAFYTLDMSRDLLLSLAAPFPTHNLEELVSTGLIEKLIKATLSMTDFLSTQPLSRDPFAVGPREFLDYILATVALARNGEYRFLPLLMTKMSDIMPRIISPMLQHAPDCLGLSTVDIFDGFGNAGMAQPPQMQIMDADYALDVNQTHTSPEPVISHASHTSPASTSDMNNSFAASSDMMSSSSPMEYTHNINAFPVNPTSDLVMNSMNNGHSPRHIQLQMRPSLPMNMMTQLQSHTFPLHGNDFPNEQSDWALTRPAEHGQRIKRE